MSREWFSDADLTHPLTALRIPVIGDPYPDWRYEVALVIGTGSGVPHWDGYEPTEDEARLLAAVLDYRMRYYRHGWAAQMRERALDVDSSTNTLIFLKDRAGGWHYRRASWTSGPCLVPDYRRPEPLTLPQVIDECYAIGDDWTQDFKAWRDEPDVALLYQRCSTLMPPAVTR